MLKAFELKDGKYVNPYLESKADTKIVFDTQKEVDKFLRE